MRVDSGISANVLNVKDTLVRFGGDNELLLEMTEILLEDAPRLARQLQSAVERLEARFSDLQDVEFTIESGRLYLLQTRAGKRSARAMVKVACDLVREGRIGQEEAIRRCEPKRFAELLLAF